MNSQASKAQKKLAANSDGAGLEQQEGKVEIFGVADEEDEEDDYGQDAEPRT